MKNPRNFVKLDISNDHHFGLVTRAIFARAVLILIFAPLADYQLRCTLVFASHELLKEEEGGRGGVKGQSELSTHSHTPGLCLFFAFNLNLCSRRAWNAGVTLRLVRLDDKQR